LEAILVWGKANEHNPSSKFYEAFVTLKERQVKFPSELKYFGGQQRRKSSPQPILSKPISTYDYSGKQSIMSILPPNLPNTTESIFTLMDKYD
jgi:hypothetical protein